MVQQSALQKLKQAAYEAWKPRQQVKVSEWCADNIRLSKLWEASGGPYNLDDNPFLIDILDAFLDTSVYKITVKKSTQVGGTLMGIALQICLSELDPAPAMTIWPDKDSGVEFRDRLYGNCQASNATVHKVPQTRFWNTRHIDLQTSRIYLAWAGSPQKLRGRPCKRLFRHEIDVYPSAKRGGDVIKASEQRVKRFHWSQIYDESTPDGEESAISALYDKSNMSRWWCKCPKCGRYQVLRFHPYKTGPNAGRGGVAGYRDDHGNLLPKDQARKNAKYICINGCELTSAEKNAMVKVGLWLPAGQRITKDGFIVGKPQRSRRHLGFHLWSLHSPIVTIEKIVEAFIDAEIDNTRREFFQDWLGLQYSAARKIHTWEKLGKRLRSPYERYTVPSDAWFLTAGMDVQLDGIYFVIRGWGHAGTNWLIDTGFLPRYQGSEKDDDPDAPEDLSLTSIKSDLLQLPNAILNRRFQVNGKNPLGKESMRIVGAAIDANYRTRDVHNFITALGDGRLIACRGDANVDPKARFARSLVEAPARGGKPYAGGGLDLYRIYVNAYKEELHERWLLQQGADGFCHLPLGVLQWGEKYLRQVVNEVPKDEYDRDGKKVRKWVVPKEALGNHPFDCETYAYARAEIHLATLNYSWDARSWKKSTDAALAGQSVHAPSKTASSVVVAR